MLEAWNPWFLWSVAVGPARARPASEGPVAVWTSVPRAAALRRGLTGPRSGKLGRRADAPRLPLCLSVGQSLSSLGMSNGGRHFAAGETP